MWSLREAAFHQWEKGKFFGGAYLFAHRIKISMYKHLSDEECLRRMYKKKLNKELNLDDPKTFNEKLQWLKLYNRQPKYTMLADKYAVKQYVTEKTGSEYVVPLLGVWNDFDDIDFTVLPEQFVLKCNHDCGSIVICRDKQTFDYDVARKKLTQYLNRNYYWEGREWPYRDIPPKIIAEEYLDSGDGKPPVDYKYFCFGGEPKIMFIATDRGIDTKFDFYDMDFNHLELVHGHPNANTALEKPEKFEEMRSLATVLSNGIPFVRVDFYNINGRIYFGEYTFFHWGGLMPFVPENWDYTLGSWLALPEKQE